MNKVSSTNPAKQAAEATHLAIYDCIDTGKSFLVEAGAGAGKTYSLIRALRYLIDKHGRELLRKYKKIACITYTNVAVNEIKSRTDGHPAILASTIHSFCWSLIKDFQPFLRKTLPTISDKWSKRLEEAGGIGSRKINYELGYPEVKDSEILLHHNDVLSLTVRLLNQTKFRKIFCARYPILLIDEYQDTNRELADALFTHFLSMNNNKPLIGLFGDHWQKIYGDGYGKIVHPNLKVIKQRSNFRSTNNIVNVLNRIRPELPQEPEDPNSEGVVAIYHTNSWKGNRCTGGRWAGDLPSDVAHRYLEHLKDKLSQQGWDFSPEKTKILMLTHNILAKEQGYRQIDSIFARNRDAYIRKEDPYIAFFIDSLEPISVAYKNKQYGEMFAELSNYAPAIQSRLDKKHWINAMDKLLEIRETGTVGEVISHLKQNGKPHLPYVIEEKEHELELLIEGDSNSVSSSIERHRKLREVPYREVTMLARFLDEHTPFSTKHSVKGAEFENVLVVFGRGWSWYNFNEMLEWFAEGVPPGERNHKKFVRNRNLFYVCCSRPKKRLALLFTQELTSTALSTLNRWFGEDSVQSLTLSLTDLNRFSVD